MNNTIYNLKAPEYLGDDLYFVVGSDGVNDYTKLATKESLSLYKSEFTQKEINDYKLVYPALEQFFMVEIKTTLPNKEKYYMAIINDSSSVDDLFDEFMYVVHDANNDYWAILPDSMIDPNGYSRNLTSAEIDTLRSYPLFENIIIEGIA